MNKDLGHDVTPINRGQGRTTATEGRGCTLRFDLFTPTLLSLHIDDATERTRIPLLTQEAAIALRAQLDELIPQMQPSEPQSDRDEPARRAA